MAGRHQRSEPATGAGPFEVEVFNQNLSKSFEETLVDVKDVGVYCGTHEYRATAVESENKQGEDVTVAWNHYHECWQYTPTWRPK